MSLNKLHNYVIPNLDICKVILDERSKFTSDVTWKKWAVPQIKDFMGCSKSKAFLYFDWLYFYLKDRTELVNKIINERGKDWG